MKPTLVKVITARKILNAGRTTIYKLINSGRLRSIKIGRSRRIFLDSIEELIGQEVAAPIDGVGNAQTSSEQLSSKTTEAALYSRRRPLICPPEADAEPLEAADATKNAIFFSERSCDGEK